MLVTHMNKTMPRMFKVILPGLNVNQPNVFLFVYWFTFAVFLVFCLFVFYFFLRGQGNKGLFYETYVEC